jgi:serine/threonine protein kinase
MVKRVGKYELGRTLGEGTFGKVKYAVNVETQDAVAIKVLDKEKIQKQNMGNQIKKEISIMKMVKHKYIVGMIEVLASKSKIFIVLELVTGGELFDKIVSMGKLPEDQALFYFTQLVEGVGYCHRSGVCHRDLKPENLLLDENADLKISDFGLSSLYVGDADGDGTSRTQILHTTCGTPNYVAPEVLADKGYDGKKADVWSIGVVLYVLLAGFLPFDESTIVALFSKIQAADFTYPKWFSMDIRNVIDMMLVADPAKRVTLDQLRQIPWLQEKIPAWKLPPDDDRGVPPPVAGGPVGTEGAPAATEKNGGTAEGVESAGAGDMSAEEYSRSMSKPKSFYPTTPNADGADAFDALEESIDAGPSSTRPKILNAFDLINQCGGFALDKLFAPQVDIGKNEHGHLVKKMSSKGMMAAGVAPDKAEEKLSQDERHMLSRQASVRFGGASSRRTGSFHFSSKIVPAEALMKQLYGIMKAMGFEMDDSSDGCEASGKCKGSIRTAAKGMLGLTLHVYTICSNLSLLEIRRGHGDLLEWNTIYSDLINKRITHLINRPSADGEAKADMSPRPGYP